MFNALISNDVDKLAPYIAIAISTPFDRYKQLLQLRKTIIEIQNGEIEKSNIEKCDVSAVTQLLQNPTLTDVNPMEAIRNDGLSRSIMVLTTRVTNFVFKQMIKPKLLRQPGDSDFVGDIKSISSESISRIYGLSSYYFIETWITFRLFGRKPKSYWCLYDGFPIQCLRIILQTIISDRINDELSAKFDDGSNGMISLGIGFISFSVGQALTYSLDAISKRQILTGETVVETASNLMKKYGYSAFYDGGPWEFVSDLVAYTTYMTMWVNLPI